MSIDDRTTNRSYQLPNADNQLADDVARLRAALQSIDADIFARYTKAETDALLNNLIAAAPGALNTLQELAAAMGNDPNFATTITTLLGQKANTQDVYNKAQSDARYVQGQVQIEMVFVATASQSVFTLSTPVINKPSALVSVDGVVQPTSEYSLSQDGATLTLSEGVPAGTIVRVLALGVASAGAPADDTVTTPKLRDAAVTPAKLAQPLTARTAQAAAGTSIDFTGIPAWAKRITVMFNSLSTNGTDEVQIRLGTAAGYEWTTYYSASSAITTAADVYAEVFTSGFTLIGRSVAASRHGIVTLANISGNMWVAAGNIGTTNDGTCGTLQGFKTLAGALDRLQVTTFAGTAVFDAGSVNIFYE